MPRPGYSRDGTLRRPSRVQVPSATTAISPGASERHGMITSGPPGDVFELFDLPRVERLARDLVAATHRVQLALGTAGHPEHHEDDAAVLREEIGVLGNADVGIAGVRLVEYGLRRVVCADRR